MTLGGFISTLLRFVKPALANSSTPGGYVQELRFDCSTMLCVTELIVHSPVVIKLVYVSLSVPSVARCDGPNATTGGLELNALKKLNGDRFAFPRASTVPTRAIGRGATPERKILCNSRGDSSLGVNDFMEEKKLMMMK